MFDSHDMEVGLFVLAACFAVFTLIALMRRRRDEVLRQLSQQAEQERLQHEAKQQQELRKERKDRIRKNKSA